MEIEHTGSVQPENLGKSKCQPETVGSVAIERRSAKPERIGHMLMTAESKPKRLTDKKVETMNRPDLLKLSNEIMIDGSSLRQIYETHLIGERGLRRLVAEYMRDGDLKQALRLEIVERERDFERDPAMRHLSDEIELTGDHVQSRTTLEQLLTKADLASEQASRETAFFKARARFETQELLQHKRRRRVMDISLAAVIALLLLLIIILVLRRG
jgi:hypothetical protein